MGFVLDDAGVNLSTGAIAAVTCVMWLGIFTAVKLAFGRKNTRVAPVPISWSGRVARAILVHLADTRPVLAAHLYMRMAPVASGEDADTRMALACKLPGTLAHVAWAGVALLQYTVHIRGTTVFPRNVEAVRLDARQQCVEIVQRNQLGTLILDFNDARVGKRRLTSVDVRDTGDVFID